MDGKCECFPFSFQIYCTFSLYHCTQKGQNTCESHQNCPIHAFTGIFFLFFALVPHLKFYAEVISGGRTIFYLHLNGYSLQSRLSADEQEWSHFVSKARTLFANLLIFRIYVPDLTLTFRSRHLKSTNVLSLEMQCTDIYRWNNLRRYFQCLPKYLTLSF